MVKRTVAWFGRLVFSRLRFTLLTVILLAFFPALLQTLYSGLEQRRMSAENARERAMDLVRHASSDHEEYVESSRQLSQLLAQLPAVRQGGDTCDRLLASLGKDLPIYSSLGAVSPAGALTCSSLPAAQPVEFSDRDWFQRAIQTREFAIGDYQTGRLSGKASLGMGRPIIDEDGEIRGVVYVGLDLTWLNKLTEEAEFPGGTALTVLDRNGTILVRYPSPEEWVGQPIPDNPLVKTILSRQGEGMTETDGLDGVNRLYAFVPMGREAKGDVYVAVGIPTSFAYAEADRILFNSAAGLAFVVVVGLAAVWFGSDLFILRRVGALLGATRGLAAGDLSARSGLSYGPGELSELASSFDQMAHSLEQQMAERQKAEAALGRYAAELERSNTDLQQFAYVASHDLQEPLRMVTSYVQLLAKRYKGRLDADADEFIAYAVDGARRMQMLIDDLLTYSRLGTRAKPFEATQCEAVLGQALSNLRLAIEESGAVVTHDALPAVRADQSQLLQVFQNLISNSIKFRGQAPLRVHVSSSNEDGYFLFSVRDNGIGIAPEFFERIFVVFRRLHSKQEYEGTGMGLAICKKIVERHGGRIWVESDCGRGATFQFTIPKEG